MSHREGSEASSEEDSDTPERATEHSGHNRRSDGRTGRARAAAVSSAPRLARSARPRCRSRHRARSNMKSKVKGARTKNMDKLIAAVQARECLWDKSYRGHRNRFKLERYWNEVAAEVGTTSEY